MRPTTAQPDNVFDFDSLLHPGKVFTHPRECVMGLRCDLYRVMPRVARSRWAEPFTSTIFWKRCVRWMTMARVIRRAESLCACARSRVERRLKPS
jgi:hypothetical protein